MDNTENKHSVAEIREYSQRQENIRQVRMAIQDKAVELTNLSKTESKKFTVFDKEKLRKYLKNPKSNEKQLRELSQFLYRMSPQYRRLINYYAEMIDLTAYSVVPIYDISSKRENKKQLLKRYQRTLELIRKMDMPSEIMKCLIRAWREDAFFGYSYEDRDAFFIMPLDGNYCRISSVNYDGSLNFAFDFGYFRTYPDDLEYWDDEFRQKFLLYQANPKDNRWQELDRERQMCLKVNIEETNLITPPFIQLFAQIIDLIDLQSIQSVKDELSAYKLLVARMETLSGTKDPDDFAVDIDTAIDYYRRLEESLPECVNSCISPLPIDTIEFKGTSTEDVDMIANSMKNLFNAAGVAQVLDSENISGTEGLKASILCDTLQATKILLPQIQTWHNRYLQNHLNHACPIKYLEVSPYTKNDLIEKYAAAAQYGIPVKIAYASLLGFDPLETMSLAYLEDDCLNLAERWKPLQSSHTQSGSATDTTTDTTTDKGDVTDEEEDEEENGGIYGKQIY